jgi:hypothetical protein
MMWRHVIPCITVELHIKVLPITVGQPVDACQMTLGSLASRITRAILFAAHCPLVLRPLISGSVVVN